MKRSAVFLIIALLLSGCSHSADSKDNSATPATTQAATAASAMNYLIEDSQENLISVQIPHPENMTEKEADFLQAFVSGRIKETTGTEFNLIPSETSVESENREYSQYCILLSSDITQTAKDHMSVVFEGYYYKMGSAHPVHWLFSVNYNRETLQPICFAEKYSVNEELYITFADLAEKALMEETGGTWPEEWGTFEEQFCSREKFLSALNQEEEGSNTEFNYYLTEDGVVISYPVPFAMGNHKEVLIPYDKLRSP